MGRNKNSVRKFRELIDNWPGAEFLGPIYSSFECCRCFVRAPPTSFKDSPGDFPAAHPAGGPDFKAA